MSVNTSPPALRDSGSTHEAQQTINVGAQPGNLNARSHGLYSCLQPSPYSSALSQLKSQDLAASLKDLLASTYFQSLELDEAIDQASDRRQLAALIQLRFQVSGLLSRLRMRIWSAAHHQVDLLRASRHPLALIKQTFHARGITRDCDSFLQPAGNISGTGGSAKTGKHGNTSRRKTSKFPGGLSKARPSPNHPSQLASAGLPLLGEGLREASSRSTERAGPTPPDVDRRSPHLHADKHSFSPLPEKSTLYSSAGALPPFSFSPPSEESTPNSSALAAARSSVIGRPSSSLPDYSGSTASIEFHLTSSQWSPLSPLIPVDPWSDHLRGVPPVLIAANRWGFIEHAPRPRQSFRLFKEYRRLTPLAILKEEPLPSRQSNRGRPNASPRLLLDAIFWKLANSARWSELPAAYPSWRTCQEYYRRLFNSGRLYTLLLALHDHLLRSGTSPQQLVEDGHFHIDLRGKVALLEGMTPTWQAITALLFLQLAYRVQSRKPRFTPGSSSSLEDLAPETSTSPHVARLPSRCDSLSVPSVSRTCTQDTEESHPLGPTDSERPRQLQPPEHPRPPPS